MAEPYGAAPVPRRMRSCHRARLSCLARAKWTVPGSGERGENLRQRFFFQFRLGHRVCGVARAISSAAMPLISRVRGYSHGVYNRGQTGREFLLSSRITAISLAENSVTHGGDGFFGFAGREALGEWVITRFERYQRRGNSNNVLIHNDFSYAAAHGIENTFSFGNRYLENRIVGNAICGIWAGYSRGTLISDNEIRDNRRDGLWFGARRRGAQAAGRGQDPDGHHPGHP